MLTDKQKETISILKTAYKQINSETNGVGVFLDINSIIGENQKGKNLISEIQLHNKAIKSTYQETLQDFKNKAEGDFKQLGWNLAFKGGTYLYFTNACSKGTLGYLYMDSKYQQNERINGDLFQRIDAPIYRIHFAFNNQSFGSSKGFDALLNRDEVKESILKTYNIDNR